MPFGSERVLELLTYIEQVEKLRIKPAFSVPTEYFAAHQHELKGLPEIRFNIQAEGEDIWLSVPRLKEIPPPEPDQELAPWVTVYKTPGKNHELKPIIEPPTVPETPEQNRARLEIQDRFSWYVQNQWTPWAAAELPRRKTIHRYNQLFAVHQMLDSDGGQTARCFGINGGKRLRLLPQSCYAFQSQLRPPSVCVQVRKPRGDPIPSMRLGT